MTRDLMIGLVAVAIGAGLLVLGLPNRLGESPRFLQSYAASILYSTAVLIFLVTGIVELVAWTATMAGWSTVPAINVR